MKTKSLFLSCLITLIFTTTILSKLFAQCAANFTFTVNNASVAFTDASTGYSLPNYTWNFGDSQVDYSANPTHFYNTAGTYTVCLTVQDSLTLCQNTTCLPVTVTVGCNNLSASATSTPASLCSICDGTVSGSVTGGTSPYSYLWSNASTATSQNNMCGGDYVLTITDAIGCTSNANAHVGCPDTCHADFQASANGNTIYITNWSNDTAANVQFQWDFGDATSSNLTSPGSHTYASAGTYNISLIMIDNLNQCSDTIAYPVTVGGPSSCWTSFTMIPDSFTTGLWYLYPSTTGQAPFTYLWDFGDTTTSTQYSPTHNYTYACHHVIYLSITDANGCTSTYCDSSLNHRMESANYMQTLVVINTINSVSEVKELTASVFPNPASDVVTVSFNKNFSGILRVMNITGEIISEQKIDGQKSEIDVRSFPQGVYTVSLSGLEIWKKKIVIIR